MKSIERNPYGILVVSILSYATIYLLNTNSVGVLIHKDFVAKSISDYYVFLHGLVFIGVLVAIPYAKDSLTKLRYSKSAYQYLKVLGLVATIVLYLNVIRYESNEVSTGGVFRVKEKFSEYEMHYIMINNQAISCTLSEYNLIKENEVYAVTYDWNKLFPDKGKAVNIEYIERDDNV